MHGFICVWVCVCLWVGEHKFSISLRGSVIKKSKEKKIVWSSGYILRSYFKQLRFASMGKIFALSGVISKRGILNEILFC